MHRDVETILFTEEQIRGRVSELASAIRSDYADKNPVFIGILRGSFIFMADLVREAGIECTLDFMSVSSYGGGVKSSGSVRVNKDVSCNIDGRHVIIVEDIVDSGHTLAFLKNLMATKQTASVKVCSLLDKPSRREADVAPDYLGFTIPDAFVVGYGLDYADRYRHLPYIGVLKPAVYSD